MQQGLDTHIATSPDTVMVLNEDGHLTTHGPSRTEIRQEANAGATAASARLGIAGAGPTKKPLHFEPDQAMTTRTATRPDSAASSP